MHELRGAILSGGAKPVDKAASAREACRRREAAASAPDERRSKRQRQEDRFRGVEERATILFRRKQSLVRVVNVSGNGVMIETRIQPRIGEKVVLQLGTSARREAVVRWVKPGRIGLDVGEGASGPR